MGARKRCERMCEEPAEYERVLDDVQRRPQEIKRERDARRSLGPHRHQSEASSRDTRILDQRSMTAAKETPTASPMSATLSRTQNGSGFTTCRAHLDGLSQSCIVGGLDRSHLFGIEGAHLYHRPRIRFKVVKVSNDLVASHI